MDKLRDQITVNLLSINFHDLAGPIVKFKGNSLTLTYAAVDRIVDSVLNAIESQKEH